MIFEPANAATATCTSRSSTPDLSRLSTRSQHDSQLSVPHQPLRSASRQQFPTCVVKSIAEGGVFRARAPHALERVRHSMADTAVLKHQLRSSVHAGASPRAVPAQRSTRSNGLSGTLETHRNTPSAGDLTTSKKRYRAAPTKSRRHGVRAAAITPTCAPRDAHKRLTPAARAPARPCPAHSPASLIRPSRIAVTGTQVLGHRHLEVVAWALHTATRRHP